MFNEPAMQISTEDPLKKGHFTLPPTAHSANYGPIKLTWQHSGQPGVVSRT